MTPSEMALFTAAEQKLLVETETARLEKKNEDDLIALLARVRRARNKYSDLHRRQGAGAVRASGKRYAAKTSNQRTLRKAEILEDAVSRVSRFVSRAARANANAVRDQRLAAARSARSGSAANQARAPKTKRRPAGSKKGKSQTDIVSGKRVGATSAANKRQQAAKDSRRTPRKG